MTLGLVASFPAVQSLERKCSLKTLTRAHTYTRTNWFKRAYFFSLFNWLLTSCQRKVCKKKKLLRKRLLHFHLINSFQGSYLPQTSLYSPHKYLSSYKWIWNAIFLLFFFSFFGRSSFPCSSLIASRSTSFHNYTIPQLERADGKITSQTAPSSRQD